MTLAADSKVQHQEGAGKQRFPLDKRHLAADINVQQEAGVNNSHGYMCGMR